MTMIRRLNYLYSATTERFYAVKKDYRGFLQRHYWGRKERPIHAEGLQWKNIERVELILGKGRLEVRRTF